MLLPNGNVLVAGYSGTPQRDGFFASFKPDGNLDSNFGTGGTLLLDMSPGFSDYITAVATVSPDKILFAGSAFNQWVTGRLTATGTLDTTFADAGLTTHGTTTSQEAASNVAILSDGRIVMIGASEVRGQNDTATIQLTSNGGLDSTFADGGIQITMPSVGPTYSQGLILLSGGGRILAGTDLDNNKEHGVVMRMLATGDLDPTFGTGGFSEAALEGGWRCAVRQPDGKIIVAGAYKIDTLNNGIAVGRYIP
jgi:uncharacterized delta-60 repeat protein